MSIANYDLYKLDGLRSSLNAWSDMFHSPGISAALSSLEACGINISDHSKSVLDSYLESQEEEEMSLDSAMNGMFGDMFSRLGKGMCRLGLNGQMAVKTSNGYKTYDVKTGRLTNVTQFCFDIGQEFFFVVPTTKAKTGDILLIDGKPKCVIENNANKTIKVMDYENSAIQEIVPERHFFMGQMFFYRKIVSMFGSNNFLKKGKGISGMMGMMFKMNMLKSFMGGDGFSAGNGDANSMLGMMMMSNMLGGKDGDMDLSEMFDFDFEEADFDPTTAVEDETPEEKKARLKAELAALEAAEKKA
jgi:hypothetical protein